jgi:GNAT superfamily N-acetyltransferase
MQIVEATEPDLIEVRSIFWEYLQWANANLAQAFGVTFDIAAMLEGDMAGIDEYYPPRGRLLLAKVDGATAGCTCMQTLGEGVAELKRTYVRPAYRGRGIGRALVQAIIDDLGAAGYTTLRLDSANFMQDAHRLYRALGVQEREAYPESEIPPEFHANWTFIERKLGG